MNTYRDPSKPLDARVRDLLSRMNLDEKLAEITAVWAFELLDAGEFSPRQAESLLRNGIGHISRGAVGTALAPADLARFVNGIQSFLKEHSRLGIPAIVHEECLNGFMAKDATVFPQVIGLASTWEPKLISRMTAIIRRQMVSVGVRQGFSPVLDVVRDPRWGRVEETYGEDPFLVAVMGVEYVQGLQGPDPKEGVIATLKHFAGHGKPEAGLNWAPADIPPRMLREIYLYPFMKAVKEGGAWSVMNAYHEIDGIPCAASPELLTDILRKEWGFQGTVVSDYFAIEMLHAYHRIAGDKAEAARLALTAGVDIELPKFDCYAEPVREQLEKGTISIEVIDRAVERSLRLKFLLGLFENPFAGATDHSKIFDIPEHRELALEAARKSIVLLKNQDQILPLSRKIRTLAVIGPNAHSRRNLLGDYTYPAHIHLAAMSAAALGIALPAQDFAPDQVPVRVVTILEGIQAKAPSGMKVLYAQGCDVTGESRDGIAEAVRIAGEADAVILVVGGKSGITVDNTCGEMRDSAELALPGIQDELVRILHETGKPVVLVIVDGRPLALGWIARKIPCLVEAWLPGEEGGNAVADVLFGHTNPGGKLPITFPEKAGQIPIYYAHKPSGGRSQFWGDYVDCSTKPLYPFGHGLSYTTFQLRNLQIEPARIQPRDAVAVTCEIENTGDRAGEEVVQLYICDLFGSVTRPVKALKGFQRVRLESGEKKQLEFVVPSSELAFYDRQMRLTVEPGMFSVMVGRSSEDIELFGQFEVTEGYRPSLRSA